ncbi:MAG: ABC transporter permease [Hyphomonadaceae bacterium]|jgi:ABC-type nitrate/sulfonate/bicarbonate transport system permease component|nr:ABC transporter permease [Hyphomonadaceae bacterium]
MSRITSICITLLAILCLAAAWEAFARFGGYTPKLTPTLSMIGAALVRIAANGVLWTAILATLNRLLLGFAMAAAIGLLIGGLMGRKQWIEDMLLPIVSFVYPIPGLAYAPLFILWFGLGDVPTILLVGISSCVVIILNTWKGVKSIKPIWLRSAEVMGAGDREMLHHIVLPGALPYVMVGLRLGLANAWRILIAVEMLMSVQSGLGWLIFGAQTFLNTDVMLATIAVIGLIGVLLETQVFERIERATIVRWGMAAA